MGYHKKAVPITNISVKNYIFRSIDTVSILISPGNKNLSRDKSLLEIKISKHYILTL